MPDYGPFARFPIHGPVKAEASAGDAMNGAAVTGAGSQRVAPAGGMQVGMDELSRLPPQRLARLLLERAAEDPTLLNRLYDTVDVKTAPPRTTPIQSAPAWDAAVIGQSSRMRQA